MSSLLVRRGEVSSSEEREDVRRGGGGLGGWLGFVDVVVEG